ncbi:MAG TPA: DUF4149 domain-containing protein [Gemmatimonadaceae bacterium]|nr:DUF4149 domain-containing protein [Gemmatimonadaceae bacterium]
MSAAAPSRAGGALATVISLALWLGASAFFTIVVARAAFRVLPTRTLAGALVGGTLPTIFITGIVACGIGAIAAWSDPAGAPARALRLWAGLAGALLCAAAQFVVVGRIERLRASLGTTLEALPPGDPARAAFGRLHALSVGMLGVAMLLGLLVLVLASRHLLAIGRD